MGDDRRNEGSGAVVAIVVILGIVVLIGVLVVVGGAFLFLASTSNVQVITTQAMPAPTTSASPATPAELQSEPEDQAPVELEVGGTSVVDKSNDVEVHANGTVSLSGLQVPLEELKSKLAQLKAASATLKVKLKRSNLPEAEKASQEVLEILMLHNIAFEVQP